MLVYPIGRTYLIELLHSELQAHQVRFVDGPANQRAYAQLERLETEMRETGVVYSCPPGQHDDLGISCAMLAWAARHPHLEYWVANVRRPPRLYIAFASAFPSPQDSNRGVRVSKGG